MNAYGVRVTLLDYFPDLAIWKVAEANQDRRLADVE